MKTEKNSTNFLESYHRTLRIYWESKVKFQFKLNQISADNFGCKTIFSRYNKNYLQMDISTFGNGLES